MMRLTRGNPNVAASGVVALIILLVGAAASINLSAGLPFNLSTGWPPRQDYVLSAAFADANGVSPGAGVLVAGAQVGQVTGIRIAGNRAVVSMRISRRYSPLHRGTVAAIRYSTLLAQKYVELTPASGTPALPSGATIPSNETVTPVDFDQFLSSLDAQTRQRLQVLVQQLGGGVAGEQAAINALLGNLSSLSEQSPPILDTLRVRDPQLASIITNLDTVAAQLARSHAQLGQLVGNTAVVTQTLARNDGSLDGLLTHLASVSQDASATLRGNQGNLHQTITALEPVLEELTPQLSTTAGYARQASPTLQAEATYLIPEVLSAISQQDAAGNYLRQFVVINTCYDTLSSKPAPGSGNCLALLTGGGARPARTAAPGAKHGRTAKPGACPTATPTPTAPVIPIPLPSLPLPLTGSSPSPTPTATGCPAKKPAATATPTPAPTSGGLLGPLLNVLGGGS